jgi:hypothetical protein
MLTDDLVSYWKLDESSGNATDSHSSNTLTNANVTYDAGKIGNGALFNSTTDRFSSTSSDFAFERSDTVSFSFWIKWTGQADKVLLSRQKGDGDPWQGYNIQSTATGTKLRIEFINSISGGNYFLIDTTNAVFTSTGVWYHVVVTYSGNSNTSGITIYINGSSVALSGGTNALSGSIVGSYEFNLGNRYLSSFNIDAMLDEVGIWSRVLTSNEVTLLYNSGVGLAYPFNQGGFLAFF